MWFPAGKEDTGLMCMDQKGKDVFSFCIARPDLCVNMCRSPHVRTFWQGRRPVVSQLSQDLMLE